MTRGLMSLAWGDIRGARFYLSEPSDVAVRYAAFHLSQAVEKICKSCLKELGVPYANLNTIDSLISNLPEGQDLLSEDWLNWLGEHSPIFLEWDSKTRYAEDYKLDREYVGKFYRQVDKLYVDVGAKFELKDINASLPASKMPGHIVETTTKEGDTTGTTGNSNMRRMKLGD